MESLKLVCLDWVSQEREKYVYEDFNSASWDEIIGRVYLLKAHEAIEKLEDQEDSEERAPYENILVDFEQALLLLAKGGVRDSYYAYALTDKAIIECFSGKYDQALLTVDEALKHVTPYDPVRDCMMDNRCAILVLTGAFEEALKLLQARSNQHPEYGWLRFTMATCLLHMGRYDEAIAAYEQAMAKDKDWYDDAGLKAARLGQQPDWNEL
ncbi:MAG: hypothetical protein NVS2B12_19920 [Ktedonobacteraceae bacterium]